MSRVIFSGTLFDMPTTKRSSCMVFLLVDGLIADSCYIVFCNLFLYYILYSRETASRQKTLTLRGEIWDKVCMMLTHTVKSHKSSFWSSSLPLCHLLKPCFLEIESCFKIWSYSIAHMTLVQSDMIWLNRLS